MEGKRRRGLPSYALLVWLAACSGSGGEDDLALRADRDAAGGEGGAEPDAGAAPGASSSGDVDASADADAATEETGEAAKDAGGQVQDGGAPASDATDGGGSVDAASDSCSASDCLDAGPDASANADASTDAETDAGTDAGVACTNSPLQAEFDLVTRSGSALFVYDRSGSMAQDWQGQPTNEVIADAVVAAVSPLGGELAIGALFYPSPDLDAEPVCIDPTGIACTLTPGLVTYPGSCDTTSFDAEDQIAPSDPSGFLSAFRPADPMTAPYLPLAGGLTPLLEALQQVELELAGLPEVKTVILISDGAPNCTWDAAAAQQILSDWHASGIDVQLIGLPATIEAETTLNDLASAAGATLFIPADAAALEVHLGSLLAAIGNTTVASCTVTLTTPPHPAQDVHLLVERGAALYDVPRDLGAGAGWTLAADGTVELEGALCSAAQSGNVRAPRFVLGCVDLPSLSDP